MYRITMKNQDQMRNQTLRVCTILLLITSMSCSASVDKAASKPSSEVEAAVTQLNEGGAEIVLDSSGDVVAVKLSENTTPELIAILPGLSKLKKVDATETSFKQATFANLKSERPEIDIELPY